MFQGRRWHAEAFGDPRDVLRLAEATWPTPEVGRVLVEVTACGVGLPDLLITTGAYPLLPNPPVAPGQEVVGTVAAVPDGSAFTVGERVMGVTAFLEGWGGYADFAYLGEGTTQRVPDAMSDEEAAGFTIAFRTAHAALAQRVMVSQGDVVLVLGAAGNTGAAAVLMAKALGAKVIAVASGPERLSFCTGLGADHVVDRQTSDVVDAVHEITGGDGADVVVDPVGGDLGTRAAAAVARLGHIAVVGYASGSWLTLDPVDMVLRNYSAAGVFAAGTPAEDALAYGALRELANRGAIKTPVSSLAAFTDVPEVISGIRTAPPGKTVVLVR
ncbi:NADPH:quinone oxidoreductase (plasmid) [Mycolicibacterium arabiense]|uniref:NADPH:quinone oxidoreductase n=1 Tax=Mycolicibacterium arabiense TaxID=1286181 RepID=A0A7I7RQ67_9MYCO|nr:zinc-binding dehydrogenase [Mycolicibacterium arabiense]MCV7371996.1 zinc-binding dehydrogenase [Mycolicibacterium arabiense]BBY46683.1 NADPH:quinone oxidoreductase [Mycolicibacterium arabiense]